MSDKTYRINEIFYSLQGEGVRAGTANVFIRFTGCNLRCSKEPGPRSPGGFDCDTEFMSGRSLTLQEIYEWVQKCSKDCCWLILTGGEPGLQVDQRFCDYFKRLGYYLVIETNGTVNLKDLTLDWITVSPKVAEHAIKQREANEVKYVRGYGQGIPETAVNASHYVISPTFEGNQLDAETLTWCIGLVKQNPRWRLSCQQHKTTFGGVR